MMYYSANEEQSGKWADIGCDVRTLGNINQPNRHKLKPICERHKGKF